MKLTLVAGLFAGAAATPNLDVWNGKSLVKVDLSDLVTREAFHHLEESAGLDVWGHGRDYAEVMFDDAIADAGFKYEVVTADLHEHFTNFFASEPVCEEGKERCVGSSTSFKDLNTTIDDEYYTQYQRFDTIVAKMDTIEAESDLVEQFTFGKSFEGRDLKGFKVTGSSGFDNGKKVAVYNCGTHAREWIPPAFCVYLVHNLAAEYGSDSTITALLDEFEIHTIPITNPDGYEYSHTSSNMWRKSRKPNEGVRASVGTDLNRNFEYMWGTGGSSSLPTSDSYMGAAPFDNPESRALADYWNSLTNAVVQMDIHAYGGMWMYPMGYKSESNCRTAADKRNCGVESEADFNAHELCGMASKAAVEAVNGYTFDVGPIPYVIYQASGSTCDYAYATSGIRWAYAIEVRGNNFQPPVSNIKLSNAELYEGVKAQLECIASTLILEAAGVSLKLD